MTDSDESGSRETHASLLSGMRLSKDDARRGRCQSDFFQMYRPRLVAFFRSRGLSFHDADDLAEDLMMRLMDSLRSFRYDPNYRFRSYLRTSARHALQGFWMQHKRRMVNLGDGRLLEQEVEADLEKRIDEQFDLDLLQEAKQRVQVQVSDRDWSIFIELTETSTAPDELAVELGMTRHAVDVAKFRVVNRLKAEVRRLEDRGINDEE